MPNFNYISTLRQNCDPAEDCTPADCAGVTCQGLEWPTRIGVECHGTVSGVAGVADYNYSTACDDGDNSWVRYHVGDDLFPFFGEVMEVRFYDDLSGTGQPCTWCPDETDDYPVGPTPPEGFELSSCGSVPVAQACKGWHVFPPPLFGWDEAEFPVSYTQVSGCCEPCDAMSTNEISLALNTGAMLVVPRVRITVTGSYVRVNVAVNFIVQAQQLVREQQYTDCPAEFYCDGAGPYFGGNDWYDWVCSSQASYGWISGEFERDFPAGSEWADIVDEQIPAKAGSGNWADGIDLVQPAGPPFFYPTCHEYDYLCDDDHPGGQVLYKAVDYHGFHAQVSDAYVILRDV